MTRRLWLLGAVVLAGCSSEPPVGSVAGLVTLDGKPVEGGAVSLLAATGGTPVMADIGTDGRYKADNVPAGQVLVAVISPPPEGDAAIVKNQGAKGPPPVPKPKVQYPQKYSDSGTSGLRVTVKPLAEGLVTFDIPMKK